MTKAEETRAIQVEPVSIVSRRKAYSVPKHPAPTDLMLSGNEGQAPPLSLYKALEEAGIGAASRYPSTASLTAALAKRWGIPAARILVTAGGDDTIDRVSRVMLSEGKEMIFPSPSFEMMAQYAEIAGCKLVRVPWEPGVPYPTEDVIEAITPNTGIIAVVSPNNPSGVTTSASVVKRIAEAAPHAVVLYDLAYVEFADEDPSLEALTQPNVVVLRTLSKAWGLAGLRVGYAMAHPQMIEWMRIAGEPYAVAGTSLVLAEARIEQGQEEMKGFVEAVKHQRTELEAQLRRLGGKTSTSQGNFAFAQMPQAEWIRDALAGLGIAIRIFPGHPQLGDAMRITCPGDPDAFARLQHAIETALAPEAIIFDMDGVMVDVSQSYREAIRQTAATYGVEVTGADITAAKAEGNANNDWVLTQRLLQRAGKEVSLEAVTETFEALYQGTATQPGLHLKESLLITKEWLQALKDKLPLGIVTGRPRQDAFALLDRFGLRELFDTVVCMEDAPLKPDPAPVRLALDTLGVTRAWMIGDTPDDLRAAKGAGVVPLGVIAPTEEAARAKEVLFAAGAARVFTQTTTLADVFAHYTKNAK